MDAAQSRSAAWKIVLVAATALVYYALARVGLALALGGTASCPIWPASGVALAAAIWLGPAAGIGVFLGSWAANLPALAPEPGLTAVLAASGIALGSAAQALLGARLLGRRLAGPTPLASIGDVAAFAAATPLICLISATAGLASLLGAGLMTPELAPRAWLTWWIGDAVGVLLVTPLLFAWRPGPEDEFGEPLSPQRAGITLATAAALAASVWIGFGEPFRVGSSHPLSFLPFVALLWITVRLDARGATAGAALLAVLAHRCTVLGLGPFAAGRSLNESLLLSSVYIAASALTSYLLRAVLSERHQALSELRKAQDALKRRLTEQDEDLWTANASLRDAAQGRREDGRRIQLYREIVDELPVGITVLRREAAGDPESWVIAEMNLAGRRLSGARDENPIGRALFDFAPELRGTELPAACAEALTMGRAIEFADFRSTERVPGGRFSIKVFPLGAAQVGLVFEDVTAEKTAQDALHRSEEQLRTMIENVQDYAIFRLDERGRISSWNKAAEKITGYAAADALGRPFEIFFPPESLAAEEPAKLLRTTSDDGRAESEGWRLRKDGTRFWTNSVMTPLDDAAGVPLGFVKVMRDATEHRRVQEALEARTAALARSNSELTQFAYVASHDLQAPLRKTAAFAEQLRARLGADLDDTSLDFMQRMGRSLEGMQELITALLQLARVATNGEPPREVDLSKVAADAAEDLEEAAARVDGRVAISTLPVVTGDPRQLRQLLVNLIGNALKFSRPGTPPVVSVRGRTLEDGRCEISVADNGIGFDMAHAERIFQPFQRLHSARDYPGTGMGLAICQKIVERHEGRISAESVPGRGSTFTVVLPRGARRREAAELEKARG